MKTLIIGLDPGSGASSPTGFAVIEPLSMEIVAAQTLSAPSNLTPSERMRLIHKLAVEAMDDFKHITTAFRHAFIESFFIQGRGNQTAQQVIGALKAAVPAHVPVSDIANTTMKKLVGGSGHSDKQQVALGVYHIMGKNVRSADKITELIKAEQWDIIDALGLALAGWMQIQNPPPPKKPKKKKSRRKLATKLPKPDRVY